MVHEAASDCVCALVERMEELDSSQSWAAALEMNIFSVISKLEPSYHMAVAHEDIAKVKWLHLLYFAHLNIKKFHPLRP